MKRDGIYLSITYGGGLDHDRDEAIDAVLGDCRDGSGYDFATDERDVSAMITEADLPRVIEELRAIGGLVLRAKIDGRWVDLTAGRPS